MRFFAWWFGIGIPLAAGLTWMVTIVWPAGSYDLHELAGAGCGLVGLGVGGLVAIWDESIRT